MISLVSLFAGRVVWGAFCDRTIEIKLQEFRAAGANVFPDQIYRPRFALDSNPGFRLQNALDGLNELDTSAFIYSNGDPDIIRKNWDTITNELALISDALQHVRGVADLPPGYWPRHVPDIHNILRDGSPRHVAKHLNTVAMKLFLEGDHEQAYRTFLDVLTITETMDLERTHLVNLLIAISNEAMVSHLVKDSSPWLSVGVSQIPEITPAKRETVRALMLRLDQIDLPTRIEQTLYAESRFGRIWLESWLDGSSEMSRSTPLPMASLIFAPLLRHDHLNQMLFVPHMKRAAQASHWQESAAIINRHVPTYSTIHHRVCYFTMTSIRFDYDWILQMQIKNLTLSRMARVMLAIRLYEIDHGQRPPALNALLEDSVDGPYLNELPIDLFGDGKATFRYIPDSDDPRIYSLGSDGIDDGGVENMATDPDIVFSLKGRPEAEPFATKPLEPPTDEN
jgi:hypothetical protein